MKRILIIEDDLALCKELKTLLDNAGYEGLTVRNFDQVLETIRDLQPDLILLDINIPIVNGEVLLKTLRKENNVPVIMVTSRNTDIDEVLCMSYGADDYITKPYNPTILLLRIEAIFKRMQKENTVLHYQELEIIPDRGIIRRKDKETILTKNEMLIFKLLIIKQGTIVSREEMMSYLWTSYEFVDDNTLTVNVSRLRNKLKDMDYPDIIETRKGQGYILL